MSWLDNIREMLGSAQAPLRSGAEFAVQQGLQPAVNALGGAGNFARGAGMTMGHLIAGRPEEAQDVARRAFTGIGNESQRISGAEALGINNPGTVVGIAADLATDPAALVAAGGLLNRGGRALINKLSPEGSNLLPLRRQFTRIEAGADAAGNPTLHPIGGMNALEPGQTMAGRANQVQEGAAKILGDMTGTMGDMGGGYYIPARTSVTPIGSSRGLIRHENFHGLSDIARNAGDSSALGIVGRLANRMQSANSPLLQGLGMATEEMGAHGAQEVGRLAQARQMARFLTNPVEGYAQDFGGISPLAGAIYRHQVVPRVGLGLAGAAGAGTANALRGNE